MRAFRAEIAALAFFLLASPAFAQIGAPTPLVPPADMPPAGTAPRSVTPSVPPSDSAIEATPLAPVDSSWAGVLGAADGALPSDMWSTTPRSFVRDALPLLAPTTSPGLQDLARRLLLSDAIAPQGADLANLPNLLELRLDRLLALGIVQGVALIDAAPSASASENFDRDAVELRIAANDVAGACQSVRDRVGRYNDSWWTQATVACQALSGEYAEAALGLSVLREQKTGRDPIFEALIDTIDGHRQKLDRLPDPTPLRMALLAAAQLPLPPDALAAAGPAALDVWAASSRVPVAQRLAAAERAEALGALPPEGLGLIYASVALKPSEQAALSKSGKLADDPRARAMLYDAARTTSDPSARVAALQPLLADARRRGSFIPMARLAAPLIAEIQPAPDFQSFAGDAARALLAAHRADAAAGWLDLAGTPELRLIADFAAQTGSEDVAAALEPAMAALTARDAAAAPRQGDLLVALLAALGERANTDQLAALVMPAQTGTVPSSALWLDQIEAADGHRLGETVLASLVLAASGDRLTAEPIVLQRVVAGLREVGLDAEARSLAVEAALDAGI